MKLGKSKNTSLHSPRLAARGLLSDVAWLVGVVFLASIGCSPAIAADKPNIVVIMGDDIGMWNIGAYHRGLMAGRTPNIDQLAAKGAIFTDYYAEASCTAGRANFITGQLPIRTGMTTVGQAGAKIGMPAAAPTIATALKDMGYATGQFGKNHLGDRNEFLPTVARLRRVLRLPLSPGCHGRPVSPRLLPAESEGQVRAAQHPALLGHRRG